MAAMLFTLLSLMIETAGQSLDPWTSNHHPTDVAKQESHELSGRRAEYVVMQGGTMDGRNCRSPQGVWQPFQQSWESNRCVIMETWARPIWSMACHRSLPLVRVMPGSLWGVGQGRVMMSQKLVASPAYARIQRPRHPSTLKGSILDHPFHVFPSSRAPSVRAN